MSTIHHLYRYERGYYSAEFGSAKTNLVKFKVISETPKGYWITCGYADKRFVLKDAKKRYAYETPEAAHVNFIKRTERCIKILRGQLRKAENFLSCAKQPTKTI